MRCPRILVDLIEYTSSTAVWKADCSPNHPLLLSKVRSGKNSLHEDVSSVTLEVNAWPSFLAHRMLSMHVSYEATTDSASIFPNGASV